MYSELNTWAKRQELQREYARLDLLSEAREVAAEAQSRSWGVPRRLWGLANSGLSALRLLPRSA
jgi:hypothetical protein